MRKTSVIMPVILLVAGLAGCYLRRTELMTVFEASGFPVLYQPVTLALLGLSAAAVLVSLVFSIVMAARFTSRPDYKRAFKPSGLLYLVAFFVLGVALALFSVYYGMTVRAMGTASVLEYLFAALGLLSGISFIVLAYGSYKGSRGNAPMIFGIFPVLFPCLWLILLYKEHSTDPVLLRYGYQCLAIAAATLSFYYAGGMAYRKKAPGRTVFAHLVGIFFCGVVLFEEILLPLRVFFLILLLAQLLNAVVFIRNLVHKSEAE
ncbi:MAG: hypothetical protein IKD79_04945 [Oscillospiraceae bacterium]|nr:hypothetical protein [Oscillospiraceae bacterium]